MTGYGKVYHYEYTGFGLTADLPENTHLTLELTSGNLVYVDATTQIILYHYNVTTGVETQLDIDPSDSSGDNKSRDQKIQALFHDRTNQVIWSLDCDNDGASEIFDVCKIDYSGSETAPAVTEVDSQDVGNVTRSYDIWVYDGNTYALVTTEAGGGPGVKVYDVDTSPFVLKDSSVSNAGNTCSNVQIIGDNAYFVWLSGNELVIFWYDHSATNLSWSGGGGDLPLADYTIPTNRNLAGVAYNDPYFYFVLVKTGDGKNYLYNYVIDGDDLTEISEYDIALMMDRNNISTNDAPNNIEKAFHVSNQYIYKLSRLKSGVYKIYDLANADTVPTGVIEAITDNYLITNDKKVYKYIDFM